MSVTNLTAVLILTGGESVYASCYGPIEGKFGLYIGMMDETLSGSQRPRDLLTSEPIYSTASLATKAAKKIIADIRAQAAEPGAGRGDDQQS